MNAIRGISIRDTGQSDAVKNNAHAETALDVNNKIGGNFGHDLVKTRICPFCQAIIPAEQDPCLNCGRLEPADEETLKAYYAKETRDNFVICSLELEFGIFFGLLDILSQG